MCEGCTEYVSVESGGWFRVRELGEDEDEDVFVKRGVAGMRLVKRDVLMGSCRWVEDSMWR